MTMKRVDTIRLDYLEGCEIQYRRLLDKIQDLGEKWQEGDIDGDTFVLEIGTFVGIFDEERR